MEEIYDVGGHLDLVVTLHDHIATKKSGRIYVDDFCSKHGIPVQKIRNINDPDAIEGIAAANLDWLFIIGWSQIARRPVLEAPRKGVLGMHPTLLPEGRGRAAIPWAILKGLKQTGVTLFQLDEGVDTGPILAQEVVPIGERETATTLYERVNDAHRTLIRRIWPDLVNDRIQPVPQDDSRATVWPGRKPEDGRIDPTMTVEEVDRLVRAVTRPYPGAFIDLDGKRLRIWAGRPAETASGSANGAIVLQLSDGMYEPVEYQWEPQSSATMQIATD